jgi:precorrin-2 methylase
VQDLVQRGIIVIGAGGEFSGNAPLLRYDAAQWLSRAIKNLEGTRSGVDLTPQITTLTTLVSSLETALNREVQALQVQIAQVAQGAGAEAAQKAQTAFVLGVTGVVLALAAVALALWF